MKNEIIHIKISKSVQKTVKDPKFVALGNRSKPDFIKK
jgi:hypothetical protein